MTTVDEATDTRRGGVTGGDAVLLVEDDPDVAMLIRQLLTEEGYAVRVAGSGEEGLTYFTPQGTDLVILDMMLPGMNGWEVCQAIKSQQARPYVPVLMLTARAGLRDRVRGLEAGADDYLTKPFDIDELLAHVRAMLRIRRAEVMLWQHAQELEALTALATAVNATLDLDHTLTQAVAQVVAITGARAGAIWLADEAGTAFTLAAHTGLADEGLEEMRRLRRRQSVAGRALREGAAVRLTAPEIDDALLHEGSLLRAAVYLPLTARVGPLGLLAVGSERDDAFPPATVKLLTALSLTIGIAADNARLYAQARRFADTDSVTGLYNHRYIQDAVEAEIRRASRSRRPFTIMMMDLDNFKAFNDTFGHPAGDQILRDVARLLTDICRKTDVVGRYGGDEFITVLPETDAEQARVLADRIRTAFAELPSQIDNAQVTVSLSIGIAVYPFDSAVRQELIKAADLALYQAKRLGGGRASVASGSAARAPRRADDPFAHLESLVNVADARTGFSRAHAESSARYAAQVAAQIGLPDATSRAVRIAGLLHDVGNIGIPSELLKRRGPLTDEEREIIKQHVILSEMLIEQVPYLDEVTQAVIHHHEHWDGSGYPRGLAGEEIPLLGRLLAVATAFAAMRAERPYRAALGETEALRELEGGAGRQFDPGMVTALGAALHRPADGPPAADDVAGAAE